MRQGPVGSNAKPPRAQQPLQSCFNPARVIDRLKGPAANWRLRGERSMQASPKPCSVCAASLLLLCRSEIRLPGRFLAARGGGDHLGLFLLRLLGFAIAALLTLRHVALLEWFELVQFVRLQHPPTRGADPDIHVAFA